MNALSGLINPAQIGQQFQQAFQQGQKQRRDTETRKALSVLGRDPTDEAARATVFESNPELGMRIGEFADKVAMRSALGDYVTAGSQPNALLPTPVRPPAGQQTPSPQMAQPGPDLSVLGKPSSQQDAAFLRMLKIDPVQAIKIRSTMRDDFVSRMEAESEFYGLAVDALSRVTDDIGWQASLQRLAPMAQAIGGDMSSIPARYPGPEATQQLLESVLPVKDRLDYLMREADVEADNARLDRNTDSLIGDREARRAEQRRYNEARLATTRRGQDMTDSRVRSGRTGKSGNEKLPTVSTPEEARKLPSGTRFRTPSGKIKIVP